MSKFKLGLYAQYANFNGSFTGVTAIKNSNDVHKSNLDSKSITWELITENPELIYKDKSWFNIPKQLENYSTATCEICKRTLSTDDFIHIATDEDDDHITQCLDCC